MGDELTEPGAPGDLVIPARRSAWFTRFFTGYAERMLRKAFAHVRLTRGSGTLLRSIGCDAGPAIVAINHAAWWDPLVGLVLAGAFMPERTLSAPIEAKQLSRFRFMRRLGLFGIDPDHPGALGAFVQHAAERFAAEPNTVLGLTPQGSFTDVRTPVRIRPGAGAVAARLDGVRVATVSCEYVFWADRKPDLLIHAHACPTPDRVTTAGWTRALTDSMEHGRRTLASLSIARDTSEFEPLFGQAGASVHPVYDLLLRLRGTRAEIEPVRRDSGRRDPGRRDSDRRDPGRHDSVSRVGDLRETGPREIGLREIGPQDAGPQEAGA